MRVFGSTTRSFGFTSAQPASARSANRGTRRAGTLRVGLIAGPSLRCPYFPPGDCTSQGVVDARSLTPPPDPARLPPPPAPTGRCATQGRGERMRMSPLRVRGSWCRWLMAVVLPAALWPAAGVAQAPSWETLMAAGEGARREARFAEAERSLRAALSEAERLAPDGRETAVTLTGLAAPYVAPWPDAE